MSTAASRKRPLLERVGPWQMAFLLVTLVEGQESTIFNSVVTPIAGRDLWICVLAGTGLGLLAMRLWTELLKRFPGDGIERIAERLIGPFRWFFILPMVLFLTYYTALACRSFTSLSGMVFPTTPPPAFVLPLVVLAVYSGILGLAAVARVNQVLLWFIDVPAGIVLSILLTGQQRVQRVLPVLAHGMMPVVSGTLMMLGLFCQLAVVMTFAPNTKDQPRARRAFLVAIGMVGVMAMGHNMGPMLQFGGLAKQMAWPDFSQLRLIQVGRDIQRLDAFAVVLWVHGYWVLVTLNLKASALLLQRSFKQPSDRGFLLGLGVAAYAGAFVVAANQNWMLKEVQWSNEVFFPVLGLGVPLLLLGLSVLSQGRRRRSPASSG